MRLSDAGIKMIVGFEGRHRALGDGRYIAYRCPAGVWTIYAGVTKGVHEGMICTEAEGEAMFRRELATHEAAVNRMVTVSINQNQFDALVSFAYNCGDGALQKSSLLRLLNAGDYAGAARSFAAWNKGGGRVLPGLVTRRAREASLFLKPMADQVSPEPSMPQAVEPPSVKEEHIEAHEELVEHSLWYGIKRWFGKLLGGGSIAGAGASMFSGLPSDPVTIALLLLGAALVVLVGLEVLQFLQRNKLMRAKP